MGLAPTTSTTMQMALGDALAVALLTRRGFDAGGFRPIHPGGRLGARLRRVRELMHAGERCRWPRPTTTMDRALLRDDRASGSAASASSATDGGSSASSPTATCAAPWARICCARRVGEVMTPAPRTIGPDALAAEALHAMNAARGRSPRCSWWTRAGRPVGILHIHDLLRAGVA